MHRTETKMDNENQNSVEQPQDSGAEKTSEKPKKKKNELELLKEQLETEKELLLRTAAEYDNYRKRTEKEKQGSVDYGVCRAVAAMLPALDNLERAADAETADAEYKKGVDMTLAQFKAALTSLGVMEIEAMGLPFNPDLHAAAAQLEAEGAESGTVTAVMQKGYIKDSRVIRHAMVAVAP